MAQDVEKKLEETKKSLPERAKKDLEENIKNYKRLIMKMARKYVRNRVEYDDLIQEAMIGLILADRDFDETRSNNFHTYAIYRMKGKMYEYCILNENPIYVPTHVAKAASYIKQMQKLLDKQPTITADSPSIEDIIAVERHEAEKELGNSAEEKLKELKRKLGRIAYNSKMTYERLAGLALTSISLIVSDEVLNKFPEESEIIDELVSNRELSQQLKESLGEKRFMVLSMRSMDWTYKEIAVQLYKLGYRNKENKQMSRQAVKAILDETLEAVRKSRLFRSMVE